MTDNVDGVRFQRVKLDIGATGASSPVLVGNGLPVTGTFWQATQPVSSGASTAVASNVSNCVTSSLSIRAPEKLPRYCT